MTILNFGHRSVPAETGARSHCMALMALAYMLLRIARFGGALFSTFYGVANIVFGWLLYRSYGWGRGHAGVASQPGM